MAGTGTAASKGNDLRCGAALTLLLSGDVPTGLIAPPAFGGRASGCPADPLHPGRPQSSAKPLFHIAAEKPGSRQCAAGTIRRRALRWRPIRGASGQALETAQLGLYFAGIFR